jgi:SAM-dependent methyltransferase
MDDVAGLYSRAAPIYSEQGPPYFAHAGQRLVGLTAVQSGDAVLDVATGRGAVLLPAARLVGTSGRVVGIDISPGMIEHTRRAIAREGLAQATVEHMDAATLASFDSGVFSHALCSFAVFWFPDLAQVLGEVRRVVRAGGAVGIAFSRGSDPRWSWYEELLRDVGAFDGLPGSIGTPGIRKPGVLVTALEQAGFVDSVDVEEETELFYASPEAWWDSLWAHGARRPLEWLEPDVLAVIRAECLDRVRRMVQAEGVPERVRFAYVLARKPAESQRS